MDEQRPIRGTFSGRMTALVLAAVAGTLVICLLAIVWLTAQRIHDQAEQQALGIARSVASIPDVRELVAVQAELETLDPVQLAEGHLQATLEEVRERTGALFVIATEDRGLRLVHPNLDLIGQRVSTDPVALRGVEDTSTERGTLGESVRAKVPVWSADGERVVGEISVGVGVAAVSADMRQAAVSVAVVGVVGLGLALLSAVYLKRRLRRLTLGLEPDEIAASARDQAAVLYGVQDGVIGVSPEGIITVRNKAARMLLDLPHRADPDDVVGRRYDESGLPGALTEAVAEALQSGASANGLRLAVGESSMIASVVPVHRDGVDLGGVVMLKDTTAVEALGSRLDAVETMASALRAQRHEFANRLHALSGLLAAGQLEAAQEFLQQVIESGPVKDPVPGIDTVQDTFLRAFVGAKGVQAHELGMELRVGPETSFWQTVVDPQDATAVLGNLVDNAVRAALEGHGLEGHGPEGHDAVPVGLDGPAGAAGTTGTTDRGSAVPWVEVDVLGEGDTLHLAVADSGDGVPTGLDVFAPGATTREGGEHEAHGHGVGLSLARRLARQRGGDVWLADPGGLGEAGTGPSGAVFCARIPGVLSTSMEGER
ncbi:sensor histidine kinase [Citricoccus muralis]|uniref:histidine kinase n=1 Tax=Citricoccus muralis TaxID=169134 RepID=A0A3D9LGV0_9MICC|nr:ATP-binding protein [Citricoccus muralis]REE04333.1 two-component system CitB family sensor kinase [Citricoccus muralis]